MKTVQDLVAALNAKFGDYTFIVDLGRKYHRVVKHTHGQRSAYCFVDDAGNVYKNDGWKRPAKGIRATLPTLDMGRVDEFGSWLYR